MRGQPLRPFLFGREHRVRRHGLVDRVRPPLGGHRGAAGLELFADHRAAGVDHLADMIVQHDGRAGDIVEQALHPVVKPRQPMFHPGGLAARADAFVQRVAGAAAVLAAIALPEPGDRGFVQDHLGHGGQLDPVQLFGGALRVGVETPRAVQHIAEQVHADRAGGAGGIDVNDAAADRVIARIGHGRGLREAHADQEIAQPGLVDAVAHAGDERRAAHQIAGRHPLQHRVQRGQQDERPLDAPLRQPGQRRHARGLNLGRGRDAVIGGRVPSRKIQHRQMRRHEGQRLARRLHAAVVAGHVDHGGAAVFGSRRLARDQRGVIAFGRTGQDQLVGHGC